MIRVNRSLQISLMHLKGRIKRHPMCSSYIIKSWWMLKRLRYKILHTIGHYPLSAASDSGYYKLQPSELADPITANLVEPHSIGVSCIASELDFHLPKFKETFMEMIEPVGKMDRKSWEFVMAAIGLKQLGALGSDKKGLGVGSGCEKPLYYFAKYTGEVIGTDLYLNNDLNWQHTAHSDVLANPSKYAPFNYPKKNLKLIHMNAMDLKFDNNTFDYAFSISSIEHFGSRENIQKTMQEIERVLKPGAVAAISTEFILGKDVTHPEFFNHEDLQKHMIKSHNMDLIGPIDFRLSNQDLSHVLDFDQDMNKPVSIIFKSGSLIFTPLLLFFRKHI